ncbi:MAG: hypothetical protein RJA70_3028 [Pseudomonadota bacterium]|jgi:hypothetical protein
MRENWKPLLAILCFPACGGALAREVEAPFAPGQQQIQAFADEIAYRPCPPNLPAGCEMAVLEGNPKAPGLFTLRIHSLAPFVLPPHSHPRAERVTVLTGAVHVGFGASVNRATAQKFGAGDYYVNRPSIQHYVFADEPVTIQITGIGPWVVEK